MQRRHNVHLIWIGAATAVVPSALLFLHTTLLFVIPVVFGIALICVGCGTGDRVVLNLIALSAALAAWVGPFAVIAILDRPGDPVEFVVPTGFQGTIELVKDRENGIALDSQGGKFVIVVPTSGRLLIKDGVPFHRWHGEACRDADGKPRILQDQGLTAGNRRTGPNSTEASSDFDGTTYRWTVR